MFPSIDRDEYLYLSPEGFQNMFHLYNPNSPQKNFNWTTDYTFELPIHLKKSGPGSERPFTLIEAFQNVTQKIPDHPALKVKRNKQWLTWNYKKYSDDVRSFAKALMTCKITSYSAVNVIGFNSPEWVITFYGSIFGNYLPVGIYTNNSPEGCKYVSLHSDAEVVVVENRVQLNKYLQIWTDLPKIKYVLIYNDEVPQNLPPERKGKVLTFNEFLEIGKKSKNDEELEAKIRTNKPGNCCTLIYTSGTTGPPKGVMISHDNYTWTASSLWKAVGNLEFGKERFMSYLPLSHVATQIVDIILSILVGAEVIFAEPIALQGALVENLREVRPTLFFGVPRIWEKIEEKIKATEEKNSSFENRLVKWARTHGVEGTLAQIHNKPVSFWFSLADRLVFSKIKKNLGLDQTKYFSFGAAPMAAETRKFFISNNFFLRNSYGMSECSGPETKTVPLLFTSADKATLESCGVPYEGTDLILHQPDKDGNGELCFKGRNRFMGYYKNEEETRNTIDERGFLHSGDVAYFDKFGNVRITGRIKELIITAGGENVAPVLIECQVKEELPFISNAMVLGDKMKYLVILLTLKLALDKTGKPTENLSEETLKLIQNFGSNSKTYSEAKQDNKIQNAINEGIKKANEKAISRAQTIRKWSLIPGDFTVDGGELTPTMKLKRKFTASKYAETILQLYQDAKL